jgi:hypothetical protein
VEIKCQLDATDVFLLQILLLAQHVSGTIVPIIRSSRLLYKWLLPVVFGAWFSSCRYGVELKVVCPVYGLLPANWTIRSAIKIHLLHLVRVLFPHIIDDSRSKPHHSKYLLTFWLLLTSQWATFYLNFILGYFMICFVYMTMYTDGVMEFTCSISCGS